MAYEIISISTFKIDFIMTADYAKTWKSINNNGMLNSQKH